MQRPWSETVEDHRRALQKAALDATDALMVERGPWGISMSEIAKRAGMGRATLYRYFPDIEAVLRAWQKRQIERHLDALRQLTSPTEGPTGQLEAVLKRYAEIVWERHELDDSDHLHPAGHVAYGEGQLYELVADLLAATARAGELRTDIPPTELAVYCVDALRAAKAASSPAGAHRLAGLVLSSLRPKPSY